MTKKNVEIGLFCLAIFAETTASTRKPPTHHPPIHPLNRLKNPHSPPQRFPHPAAILPVQFCQREKERFQCAHTVNERDKVEFRAIFGFVLFI